MLQSSASSTLRSSARSFALNSSWFPSASSSTVRIHFTSFFSTSSTIPNQDPASKSRLGVVENRSQSQSLPQSSPKPTNPEQQSSPSEPLASDQPTSTADGTKSLARILAESIKVSGPLSVSTYMRTALLDPSYGYYTSSTDGKTDGSGRDVLGSRGDFITSPEISQVFGELVAIYFVSRWQAVEMPKKIRLIELGPGRGTLLSDMVRTFSVFPTLLNSLSKIHLVETSTGLMDLQYQALSKVLEKAGKKLVGPLEERETAIQREENEIEVDWFPRVEGVPIENDSYTMLVAHEFFDALPTHIFEKTRDGFREVLVDIKRKSQGQSGVTVLKSSDMTFASHNASTSPDSKPEFQYVLSSNPTPWSTLLASRSPRFKHLKDGQRVEISPEGWAVSRRIGELISGRESKSSPVSKESWERFSGSEKDAFRQIEQDRTKNDTQGGSALVVDYGDEKAFGGSFRAFKNHKIVDPLENPGTADLTSNVDFLHLKTAIQTTGARSLPIMFQSHFLQALGLQPRVDALLKSASSDERRKDMESSSKRLIDPTGMGAQYKVMGVEAPKRKAGESDEPATEQKIEEKLIEKKIYPFEL